MTQTKQAFIDLLYFFDGFFDTDYNFWKVPKRYKKAVLKSMQVYGYSVTCIESAKDKTLCKVVDDQTGKTIHFVNFYRGKIRKA